MYRKIKLGVNTDAAVTVLFLIMAHDYFQVGSYHCSGCFIILNTELFANKQQLLLDSGIIIYNDLQLCVESVN